MRKQNSGFTLAEVLVATVIGVISIAAAFASYGYFNKSYKSISQKANINNTAREALSILTKELRMAGYVDPNFLANSPENMTERTVRMNALSVSSKRFGGKYGQSDYLQLWYTNSAKESHYIVYMLQKYQNSNDYYLGKYATLNRLHPQGGKMYMRNELFIPFVEDFQVILKDKEGKILVPVCNSGCGSVEDSQGRLTLVNTKYGQLTKGQANVDLVHTAEIYLTLRSPKEVYPSAKSTKIINGEAPHGSNIDIPADKYHRETFFVSVHTRNLAKHVAISEQTGTSIGESSSYNK
ncbi:prepilin-type N-terminal cleavage/methylation domain-containing protein [Candidatus Pelagibacter sp.]|nr:prepilin-type N-terminal cleavage/methylation domain-containing protein [Candidatus Pelagibacter sp.]